MNVIVTCSNRKRGTVPARFKLRNYRARSQAARLTRWCERLFHETGGPVETVGRLYQGEHWSIIRSLAEGAIQPGVDLSLRVLSAGYGLLRLDDLIHPYAATFAAGHEDSVVRASDTGGETAAGWWEQLCVRRRERSGPLPATPESEKERAYSIRDLAELRPDEPLLVAVSAAYLNAVRDDLVAARASLADPELLTVICCGADSIPELGQALVPCDSRFETYFRTLDENGGSHGVGTRGALNSRVLRLVLERANPKKMTAPRLAELLGGYLEGLSFPPRPDNAQRSDSRIANWIRSNFDRRSSRTALLRLYRDSGLACEQKRFARIYGEVAAEIDPTSLFDSASRGSS